MWKRALPWVASFLISIISSIVTWWILQSIWLASLVMLTAVLGSIACLLYLRIEEIAKTINEIKTYPRPLARCCMLHLAGFSQVFEEAYESLDLSIQHASRSFKFLGVCFGAFIFGPTDFTELIRRKAAEEGCQFQILLLDPEDKEMVIRHAMREGTTPEAISLKIKQSIAELGSLAARCNGKLEVKLYRDIPIFRLILLDEERAFVSFYGPKHWKGIRTPQLVFTRTDRSFFIPFSAFFERMYEKSERIIPRPR